MDGLGARQDEPLDTGRLRPLVGRTAELRLLEGAVRKSFQLVEVVGEPGIGKTRLLTELATITRRHGRRVLWGGAASGRGSIPFGPVVDALADHVHGAIDGQLAESEIQLLATVFPDLRADDRRAAVAHPARSRQYRAVRAVLRSLSLARELMIVLDDLHLADEMTVELIAYLVRHPLPTPVLLAIAYRPAQASFQLSSVGSGALPGLVHRLDLQPLSATDAHQLLGSELSRSTRERLYQASGGNPFYLDALARISLSPGAETPQIPDAVHASLAVELADLRPDAVLVAQSAAVIGDEFEPALLATVAEIPEDAVLAALDELAASDLVRSVGWSGRFRFRHQLVRHVVYGSSPPDWRRNAHARVACHLGKVGASAALRAPHVRHSATAGDKSAIETLVAAARSVAAQAPASSVTWYSTALSLLSEGAEPGGDIGTQRLRLLKELAFCQGVSGQLDQGRRTLRTVLRMVPATRHAERAEVAAFCARLDFLLGDYDVARQLLVSTLAEQPDPDSSEAVPLRLELAMDSLLGGRFADASTLLVKAPTGERWAIPYAALRGFGDMVVGDRIAAQGHVAAATALLDATADSHFAVWLPAIYPLCWAELATGRLASGQRHLARSVAMARATGKNLLLPLLLTGQAYAHMLAGRLDNGLETVEEALELARSFGPTPRGLLLGIRCALYSWRGDHAAALRCGLAAVEMVGPSRPWAYTLARQHLLLAQVQAGKFEAAAALVEAWGGPELPGMDAFTKTHCYLLLAKAAATRGDVGQAQRWADLTEASADARLDLDVLFVTLARAYAASIDEADTAAELAAHAATAASEIGLALQEASARLLAGSCLAVTAQRKNALAELRAAAEIFGRCGAVELHDVAVREQRRLGVRVPTVGSRSKEQARSLSAREVDVAELACAGYTNQQIAKTLVLSVRTVETHLTHIFVKLGVNNRAGIASALAANPTGPRA